MKHTFIFEAPANTDPDFIQGLLWLRIREVFTPEEWANEKVRDGAINALEGAEARATEGAICFKFSFDKAALLV